MAGSDVSAGEPPQEGVADDEKRRERGIEPGRQHQHGCPWRSRARRSPARCQAVDVHPPMRPASRWRIVAPAPVPPIVMTISVCSSARRVERPHEDHHDAVRGGGTKSPAPPHRFRRPRSRRRARAAHARARARCRPPAPPRHPPRADVHPPGAADARDWHPRRPRARRHPRSRRHALPRRAHSLSRHPAAAPHPRRAAARLRRRPTRAPARATPAHRRLRPRSYRPAPPIHRSARRASWAVAPPRSHPRRARDLPRRRRPLHAARPAAPAPRGARALARSA